MPHRIYKGKSLRGDSGREAVKGARGIASQYLTRNKALKKLQVTLKDFRRLCILKGVFPRDPKKKNSGRDKTYYHLKDIQFLQHEPLLQKFRDLKIFLRKHKKALIKHNYSKVTSLVENKPRITLDHLIKERYPEFSLALRDLDDSLNMLFLFRNIPSGLNKYHTQVTIDSCNRLTNEFLNYIIQSNSLHKVFISIKGIYFQCLVNSYPILMLIPHSFNTFLPTDVDYRIMLTFLQFYQTLQKFVNFKLFHDLGLVYPPKLDTNKFNQNAGVGSILQLEKLNNTKPIKTNDTDNNVNTNTTKSANKNKLSQQKAMELQKSVNTVINTLTKSKTKVKAAAQDIKFQEENHADNEIQVLNESDNEDDEIAEEFKQMDDNGDVNNELTAEESDKRKVTTLFKGLTFFVGREVPQDISEVIIRSAGGNCILERDLPLNTNQSSLTGVTHHIIDRPTVQSPIAKRVYIQPQYIFDSFNTRTLLPTEPYRPGVHPPPHLSPFVNNEETGYIPKQAEVLKQWGAELNTPHMAKSTQVQTKNTTKLLATTPKENKQKANTKKSNKKSEDSEEELLSSEDEEEAEEEEEDDEENDEKYINENDSSEEENDEEYEAELAAEREGLTYSEAKQSKQKKAQKQEEEDEDEEEEDDENEDEEDMDEDDEEDTKENEDMVSDDSVEEKASKTKKPIVVNKRKASAVELAAEEKELAKMMMNKKQTRLYNRMQYGIKQKADENQKLETKRQKIEQQSKNRKKPVK